MERLFSKHIDVLRTAAGDPIERKVLTCGLLRFRRIFLWAGLPLVVSLLAIALLLLSYYLMVLRGTTEPTFFLKIIDIFSLYTGLLLVVSFACLFVVMLSDKKLAHLSSLRPDEEENDDPVAAFPDPALRENDSDKAEPESPPVPSLSVETEKSEKSEKSEEMVADR